MPPVVHEVLRSSGQPLDRGTRAFFEPKFGHDFSKVRVHTDARAAASATAIGSAAYTAGRDIVFGEGRFAPSTDAGRQLIAHELTHVVQQGFWDASYGGVTEIGSVGDRHEHAADRVAASVLESAASRLSAAPVGRTPAIQRQALTCSVAPVQAECANAGASCQSAAAECASKFPKPGDLDAYIAKIQASFASSGFGPNAKRNFGHWLDGTGTDLVMPSSIFEAHPSTQATLLTHREKFLEGAQRRLADGRLKPGALSDVITYTGHSNAFSLLPPSPHSDDLAYAVGGFQLCSNARVTATRLEGNRYSIKFNEWKCQAFDCYNWDPGKGIGIPTGMLDDTTLCCVENAGKAKHFQDSTPVWDNTDAASMQEGEVLAAVPGSSPSPSTPSTPSPSSPVTPAPDDNRR